MKSFSDFNIYVPSGRSGNVKTLCPQCSASRSSPQHRKERCLSVNVDTGKWHCHNCGWEGGLEEPKGDWRNNITTIYAKPIKPPPALPRLPEDKRLSEEAQAWLKQRSISVQVARNAGCWSEDHRVEGEEQECLCFPYRVSGREVNVKYRALRAKAFTTVAGARQVFCGLETIAITAATPTVVIVEGELDMLACRVAGVANVCSVPSGANSLTDDAFESIKYLYDNDTARFTIAVDSDEKGQELQAELVRRLGAERCSAVTWPTGVKDANDMLMDEGPDELAARIAGAHLVPVAGILAGNDGSQDYWARYIGQFEQSYEVGFTGLRGLWRPQRRQLHVVTGSPGSGKSHFLAQAQVNLAREHGLKHGVFSPEMGTWGNYKAELARKYVGMPFDDGPNPRMESHHAGMAEEWIQERWFGVELEEPTLDELLRLCRIMVFRHGIDTFTIDPWNDIDTEYGSGITETQFIRRSLTKIRRAAKLLNIMFFIVAHPTKMLRTSAGGMNYPVVSPYDIEGSNSWYARADTILSVWRDMDDAKNPNEVHVLKVRHERNGARGQAALRYDHISGRFVDVEKPAPKDWGQQ